ncbi:MAG: hypothetical protein FWH27_10955 [Planctomycetaceae bacterium]|nr:hypothetical protein [Planctomycetaceae bacterium]
MTTIIAITIPGFLNLCEVHHRNAKSPPHRLGNHEFFLQVLLQLASHWQPLSESHFIKISQTANPSRNLKIAARIRDILGSNHH